MEDGYTCACESGFTGTVCQTGIVLVNFEAWSVVLIKHFLFCKKVLSCTLLNVFLLADINECESNPCENGGTCMDLEDGYNCACELGFTGTVCQTGNSFRDFTVMNHLIIL